MKHFITIIFCVFVFTLFFSKCTNKEQKNIVNGIDTTIYKIVYEKKGGVILSFKDIKRFAMAKTDPIEPTRAVEMISDHVIGDVDQVTKKLGDKITRYVDFNVSKLITFYRDYDGEKMPPDSLRIYFGVYNKNTAPNSRHEKRLTCILAGVKGKDDIYEPVKPKLWPINIGTLCPPDCDGDDFTDQNKGAKFIKRGAEKAGAKSW